jgi:hypothetical protein
LYAENIATENGYSVGSPDFEPINLQAFRQVLDKISPDIWGRVVKGIKDFKTHQKAVRLDIGELTLTVNKSGPGLLAPGM